MAQNASAQNLVVTLEEMRSRVASAPVARLGTISRGGVPHLVPFCFVLDGDVMYSAVDRKPKRSLRLRRLRNAAADPRVSVLVDNYEDDWSRLWWIRLDGRARTLEPGPEAAGAISQLEAKYAQYRLEPPPGPVLRIDVERWTGWAASESRGC
ncbi:MAG TPA: TIGR03668 family PPOX class F420-dependent oxidoreductase [Candidatus Dormibacteraeota bacterium]|nr:TIGR03668 family PPOX class F420-dependent oxidoreductase [Candidatus Dormibacteraeota bacterium]